MKQATDHLETLIQDIRNQNPKTLAYWRVTHDPNYTVLTDFANTEKENESSSQLDILLPQVQSFFDALNVQLSLQESEDVDYQAYLKSKSRETTPANTTKSSTADVSIVFGGKYPAEGKPRSISERLVTKLSDEKETTVITVSRSNISHDMPINSKHVAKQNLDSVDAVSGSAEFGEILQLAEIEPEKEDTKKCLTLYLTLGQHKGVNPFRRNLQGAHNFCLALESYMKTETDNSIKRKDACKWRVILTGTDATLPSDYPASPIQLSNESLQIPNYKIMQYNFTYAMSKLGQYFLLIRTVAELTGRADIVNEVTPIVAKIQANVDKAGDNGNYSPPEKDQETDISMDELDQYSRRSMDLEQELQEHLQFAKGISICYTPLHAVPWTQQAIESSRAADSLSPKAFVLEQVVKRLKNAISIDQAVECHFK